jgi:hypothetical protein
LWVPPQISLVAPTISPPSLSWQLLSSLADR